MEASGRCAYEYKCNGGAGIQQKVDIVLCIISEWELMGLTGVIPPELGQLSNLEILYVTPPCPCAYLDAERLPIKSRGLYRSQLTGAIPVELGKLSNLVGLYITSSRPCACPSTC